MSYKLEVPSVFVKTIADKENFYSFGYSFVNGILGKNIDDKEGKNE